VAYRIIIGSVGSDAGYWYIDSDGSLHHVGGWAPEQYSEVAQAGKVLQSAVTFKAPGLSEATVSAVHGYLQDQLREHLGDHLPDGSAVLIL
jgi:hypothetical protein